MAENLTRTLEKIELASATAELLDIRRGLEKESLRIDRCGTISQKPHPAVLGSTLTHPYITTDYAEALLEFITPVESNVTELLDFMKRVHQYVYHNLEQENLWVNSMPCILHGEDSIQIARYGSSNVGTMKSIYRTGLAWRYGKLMQTIAGIHFNFSLGDGFWRAWRDICGSTLPLRDFKSEGALGLVRNAYRYGWLIPYLFGASPAVCRTFVEGRRHHLELLGQSSYYLPFATSLRLGDLGYQSTVQAGINIGLNSISEYIDSLVHATTTPYPPYEEIGVLVGGEYRQLNTSLLQIENEYYAPIRPKRTARSGEKPSHALRERGVEYIELRSLDLNPFIPIGIGPEEVHFLDVFLIFCLLSPSPPMDDREYESRRATLKLVAERGREPGLILNDGDRQVSLTELGLSLLSKMDGLVETLDSQISTGYRHSHDIQKAKFLDPDLTPSSQVLEAMHNHDDNFFNFALERAADIESHFKEQSLSTADRDSLIRQARDSLAQQRDLEAADSIPFAEFLDDYFSQ